MSNNVWVTLTPEHLKARLSSREMEAIRRAHPESADDADAQAVLDQTCDMARGYIAGFSGNRLSSVPHSLPPALVSAALDIALVDYSASVGGVVVDPKGIRQKAYDRAIARLEKVAEGKYAVEQPAPAEASAASSAPPSTPPTSYVKVLKASRKQQEGVL